VEIVSGVPNLPPLRGPDNGWTLALIPAFSPQEKGKRSQRFGELEALGSANDIFSGTPKITRGTRVLHPENARFPALGNGGALECARCLRRFRRECFGEFSA